MACSDDVAVGGDMLKLLEERKILGLQGNGGNKKIALVTPIPGCQSRKERAASLVCTTAGLGLANFSRLPLL